MATSVRHWHWDIPFFLKDLLVYFWLQWVFIAAWAFSSCGVRVAHSSGFSCRARALECRLSSCGCMGLGAPQYVGSSQLGIEPMYLALAGGLLTIESPGKSQGVYFLFSLGCGSVLQS